MQPRTRFLSETTLRLPKEEGRKEKPRLEPSRSSIHLRKSGWMHGWLVCFRPIGVLGLRPITLGCMVEAVVSNGDTEGAYELIQSMEQDDSCRSIRFSPWCQGARIIDSKIGWSWRKHFRPWDKSPFSAYSETKKVSEYTGRKLDCSISTNRLSAMSQIFGASKIAILALFCFESLRSWL